MAVAVNTVTNITQAFVGDLPLNLGGTSSDDSAAAGSVEATNGDVTVEATSENLSIVVGIAGAIASGQKAEIECADDPLDGQSLANLFDEEPQQLSNISGEVSGIGLAGDVAINLISDTTMAYISHSDVTAGGDVTVHADNDSLMVGVTGVIAISGGNKALSIAGIWR